ncbi:MAG: GIY-YIG nuclease family protein [Rickettsiales bacterium]|nr:GIY-YIG nuclease family protein [Rickettsiales bacterium]
MYILECRDKSFYVGSTTDLERRLSEHQNGLGAVYTRKRLPVKLVFSEEFERIDEAYFCEKRVQGWSRKKRIALINKDWQAVAEFAKCVNESSSKNFSSD